MSVVAVVWKLYSLIIARVIYIFSLTGTTGVLICTNVDSTYVANEQTRACDVNFTK